MIVKNEAPIIKRCLATIKPWIDSWVITDTGSTDGTQEIIREFMKDIPGELLEVPWVDFAHNRNIALDLARKRADYSLFIDADQQFIPNAEFSGFPESKECYCIQVKEPSLWGSLTTAYFLIRNQSTLHWEGVLHEFICSTKEPAGSNLFTEGHLLSISMDGNRSQDPQKFLKDAAILEKALEKEPYHARYMFYLGQSYRNAGDFHKALKAFEQRSRMGGEPTDVFFSLFMIGVLNEFLGNEEEICLQSFTKAHLHSPHRPDPVYKMGQIYMRRKEFLKAYDLLKPYVFLYDLEDVAYVQTNIRDYLLPILFVCAAYEIQKYQESYEILKKVSRLPSLHSDLREKIEKDLIHIEELRRKDGSTETQSFPM
jgi:glycosyltransferase involved in cell wall biosynthesis